MSRKLKKAQNSVRRKLVMILETCLIASILMATSAYAATDVPFTVTMNEAVNVSGTPRILVNVDGVTRYATYASGSGSSSLTFTYAAQAGDLDLDGITLSSPIDLNGGTITDLNGNPETDLTFSVPNTSGIKVDVPSLSLDFVYDADGRYTLNGTAYNDLSSFLTASGGSFTRNSIATYFDSTGTLQTAATNQPRFDYDPLTHAPKGILIEESRTNSLRNGNMSGAIAGTSTLPTYWTLGGAGLSSGNLSQQITSIGNENGIPYVDYRLYGTPVTSGELVMYLDSVSYIPASTGQTWTSTFYAKLAGGSTNNIVFSNNVYGRKSDGSFNEANSGLIYVPTSTFTKYTHTYTLTNALTAYTVSSFGIRYTSGQPVDVTLRIGGAQLERGVFPTSYIPTTGVAVTRQADILTIPTGSWYNLSAGTVYGDISWGSTSGTSYPMLVRFDDTTNAERWNFFYDQNIGRIGFDGYTGAVGQGYFQFGPVVTSGDTKMAAAQALNNTNAAVSGVLGTPDTSWTPSTSINQLLLRTGATDAVKWLKSVKYYPRRASDTQLQLMTQ